MIVRLSQLADIDWKNGVPNQKGELDNKEIDNLRYIIQNIEHIKENKEIILKKCWKYIDNLESAEIIIQVAKIIESKPIGELPRKLVKFLGDFELQIPILEIRLVEKLAPGLNIKKLTSRQFDIIVALFEEKPLDITAQEILELEKVAEKSHFQALKDKLKPLKEARLKALHESKDPLTLQQVKDSAAFFSSLSPNERGAKFDRISQMILQSEAKGAEDQIGVFLKTLNPDEKNRFAMLLKDHLKDKDDDTYFFWHQLLDKSGLYKDKELKEGIPFYAMDKLIEKFEFFNARERFPGKKEPIDKELLGFVLQCEFGNIHAIPHLRLNKKNVASVLKFLAKQPPSDFLKTKGVIDNYISDILASLNPHNRMLETFDPKNRDDLVLAIDIHNYLHQTQNKKYDETLQKLFNRELEEARELTLWEKMVSALISFIGLAISEWVKVDKTFLLACLSELSALDLKLSPKSTVEMWDFIKTHKGLRSLDLSSIPDLPDETILELPLTIEHLNLSGNKLITDKIVDHIKKMPNLKSINISNTSLSETAKVQLKCLVEPIDLREFYVTDELLKFIPKTAKNVLLGAIHTYNPQSFTREGLAHLVKLQELNHLELAFIPEGNLSLLEDILSLKKLTSLKLVRVSSQFEDIKIIFYKYKIEKLELDSCYISPYNWHVGRDPNSDSKSTVKVFTLKNSLFPFYDNIIDSLEEIVIDTSYYNGYVYFKLLGKCKKMIVPKQRIIREIKDRMSGYIYPRDMDALMAKIIFQET